MLMCIRNQQAYPRHMSGVLSCCWNVILCLLKSDVTMTTIDNKDCFDCRRERFLKSCVRNCQGAFQQCHSARRAPVFHPAVILTFQKLNWGRKVWNQSATQTRGLYLDKQTAQWIHKLTVQLLVAEISTPLKATPEERFVSASTCPTPTNTFLFSNL